MPHTSRWLLKDKIFTIKMVGHFTKEDLANFNKDVSDFLNSSETPPVHGIVDDSELTTVSLSLSQVKDTLSAVFNTNVGWFIAVGQGNPIFNFLGKISTGLAHVNYRRVDSMEEAIALILENDPSLKNVELDLD